MDQGAIFMKILLLGSNGQIGTHLQKSLAGIGEIKPCTRKDCDLTSLKKLQKLIQEYAPNIIINAAAYTNVDKAESEFQKVQAINVDAVELMAQMAKNLGAILIHYSSDYIFDGTKTTPYTEGDKANPLSVYGLTKFQGEEKIKNSGCSYLILRTSWIYSPHGSNFVNTIIRLAKEKETLSIVNDQIGAPTSAEFVAEITAQCLKNGINSKNTGTYHLTAENSVSWYEFAKYILNYLQNKGVNFRLNPNNIIPITAKEYNLPATRPQNSTLNTELIKKTFALQISSWENQIEQMLSTIKKMDDVI